MKITNEAIEAGCAAITERRGFKWPSDFSEEELAVGRENMELAIAAAFAAMPGHELHVGRREIHDVVSAKLVAVNEAAYGKKRGDWRHLTTNQIVDAVEELLLSRGAK